MVKPEKKFRLRPVTRKRSNGLKKLPEISREPVNIATRQLHYLLALAAVPTFHPFLNLALISRNTRNRI
jgi:hypothetical protein